VSKQFHFPKEEFTIVAAASFLGFDEQLFRWCMNHTDPLFIVKPDLFLDRSGKPHPFGKGMPFFYRETLLEFSARLGAEGFMLSADGRALYSEQFLSNPLAPNSANLVEFGEPKRLK
jgi:hypothetical protein